MVRYHFVGIEGAHRGSVGGGGELMAAENRILKAQLQGRLRLSQMLSE